MKRRKAYTERLDTQREEKPMYERRKRKEDRVEVVIESNNSKTQKALAESGIWEKKEEEANRRDINRSPLWLTKNSHLDADRSGQKDKKRNLGG